MPPSVPLDRVLTHDGEILEPCAEGLPTISVEAFKWTYDK
jgi:hypothetical protein